MPRLSRRGVGLQCPPGVPPARPCCVHLAWSVHLAALSPRVRAAPSLVPSEGSGTGRVWLTLDAGRGPGNASQTLAPGTSLRPPEADREAQVQSPHVVPVLNWDKQDLSGRQDTGQERGLGKLGELLQVGILHVNLRKIQAVTCLVSRDGDTIRSVTRGPRAPTWLVLWRRCVSCGYKASDSCGEYSRMYFLPITWGDGDWSLRCCPPGQGWPPTDHRSLNPPASRTSPRLSTCCSLHPDCPIPATHVPGQVSV